MAVCKCLQHLLFNFPVESIRVFVGMVSITMGQRVAGFFSSALLVAVVLSAADAFHQPGLKLVQVVFRHADRAPDPIEMFPSDPHYNDTFFPEGLGGMTNIGKRREYQLGRILREKYHNFLGELYLPETLVARSTDYKRTKMCLQLVLAALFPPRASQRWNNNLNWQPIPTNYATSKDDWLMIPEECPEYLKERKIAEKTPEYVEKVESMREFMNNLTVFTGKNISTPNDMYNLYHILVAESSKGIKLPEWTNGIFPDGKLLDGINLEYEIFSYTKNMRRLNGGKLLHDMIEHMQEKKNGLGEKDREVYLYSGHETNIAAILQVLDVYEPHVPAYSSAVMVEFYEFRGKFYVKVDYYYGIPARTETLQIPGCDLFCPFDKFLEVLSEVTPSSDELVCDKSVKPEEIEKTYNAVQQ